MATPDTITNWLKFTPAGQIGYRRAYIDLPAFSYTGLAVAAVSVVVAQYNFSATQNFILLNRPAKPAGVNYGLCIRYRVGDVVYRYKLWQDTGFILNDDVAPLYSQQLIKKNFVLEIWSYATTTTATQITSIRMISSVRSIPTDLAIDSDYSLAIGAEFTDLANTNTYSIPAGLTSRWKADDVAVGAVSSWLDTVNATALVQAAGAAQPTKVTADATWLKGYVDFPFTGNDYLNCTMPNAGVWNGGSIYVVAELSSDIFAGLGTNWALEAGGITFFKGSNNLIYNRFFVSASVITSNINPVTARIFRNYYTYATSMGKQVDDAALVTQATTQGIANPLILEVGRSAVDGTFGPMKLADMLFFRNKTLTEAEDTQLKQYLSNYHFGAIALPLTFNAGGPWLDNI